MNDVDNLKELKANLKSLIELIMRRKPDRISDEDIRSIFERCVKIIPEFNIEKLEDICREALGFCPAHSLIYLAKRWNVLCDESQRLDLEIFLAPYKNRLREKLALMESTVERTVYLRGIFCEQYFQKIGQSIDLYDGDGSFGSDTHTAFIGFIQEYDEGSDLISRLDEAFGAIVNAIGQQRIRSLRDKMCDVSRPLKDYLGIVYEILILGSFAMKGQLVEYEPKVGQNHAEGRIKIGNQYILVEATTVIKGRDINFVGTINLEDEANRIFRKILDKAVQLRESQEAVLLFISPHTMTIPPEIKMGINKAFLQNEACLICGIILSDYRGNDFKYIRNPHRSAKQLSEETWESLIEEYELQELDLSDSWS